MKRIFTPLILIALSISQFFGQSNYVSFQGGYHFGVPTGNVNSADITFSGTSIDANGNTKSLSGTLGGGVPLQLAYGHMFNDNIGVELGFNYLFGATEIIGEDARIDALAEAYTSQFRLLPQLVLKHKGVYSKFGFMIPLFGTTTLDLKYNDLAAGGALVEAKSEVKGNPTIGFSATAGYEYSLSDNISLFGEVQFVSLSIKSKSSELIEYSVGGNDVLGTLPDFAVNTEYEDELSAAELADPTSGKALSFKRNFSSFGINLGVKYNF